MVAAPAPRTWVDKEIPPVATWNVDLSAHWTFLLNPPMVKVRQTTLQAIANNTWTALTFQTEDVDTHGFHSTSTNPSRLKPTVPGWYTGYGGVSFASNASTTTRRLMRFAKNGTTFYDRSDSLAPSPAANLVVKGVAFGPLYFNGTTDYLEVQAYQDSGGSINTDVGAGSTDYEEQPEFYMRWVSS